MPPSQDTVRREKVGRSGDRLRNSARQRWLGNWMDQDKTRSKCRHTENPARAIPRAKSQLETNINKRYTENPKRAIPRTNTKRNSFEDYQTDSERVWEEKNETQNDFMDYQLDFMRVYEEKLKLEKENQYMNELLTEY